MQGMQLFKLYVVAEKSLKNRDIERWKFYEEYSIVF